MDQLSWIFEPEEPLATGDIMIVDGPNLSHRAFHSTAPLTGGPDNMPTGAIHGAGTMLCSVLKEVQPEHVIVCWDAPGASKTRSDQHAAYKAHRPEMISDLSVQWSHIKQLFGAMGAVNCEVAGYEADDLIGALVRDAEAAGLRVVVVTADKDLLQCVSPECVVLRPAKKGYDAFDLEKVESHMGVRADQIVDLLSLQGDASDGIPGVPLIGAKSAVELLNAHETLDGVLAAAVRGEIKGKKGANLVEFAEQAHMSKRLATLLIDAPTCVDVTALPLLVNTDAHGLQKICDHFSMGALPLRHKQLLTALASRHNS